MSFSQDNGYTPKSIEAMMDEVMGNLNIEFAETYDTTSFAGTNFYRFFYLLMQRSQLNEIKTSEIFQKLQQYIETTNEKIQRPSVSFPGLLESFQSQGYLVSARTPTVDNAGLIAICVDLPVTVTGERASGSVEITSFSALVDGAADDIEIASTIFTAQAGAVTPGDETFRAATSNAATAISLAAQINAHADASLLVRARAVDSTVYIQAVQPGTAPNSYVLVVDDNNPTSAGAIPSAATLAGGTAVPVGYDGVKLAITTLISQFVCAGLVSEGSQVQTIVLSNGQSFDFKYFLPQRSPILLRLTAVKSENSMVAIPSDELIRTQIFTQANARYRLGWNFEPQRYFGLDDALWAQSLLLEYSFDAGDNWISAVFDANFDDVLTFGLENITVNIS